MSQAEAVLGTAEVTIIIPSYLPPPELVTLCRELRAAGVKRQIVVDDGSAAIHRPTFDIVAAEGTIVLRHEHNLGKGAAVKTAIKYGLAASNSNYFLVCDDDGQHRVADVLAVMQAAITGQHPFTMGVRAFTGDVPWKSRVGNYFASHWLLRQSGPARDTQSGLRCFHRDLAPLLLGIGENKFDFELKCLLILRDQKIPAHLVSIDTLYFRGNNRTRFHVVTDSWSIANTAIQHHAQRLSAVGFALLALIFMALAYHPQWNADLIGDDRARIGNVWDAYTIDHVMHGGLGDRPVLGLTIWLDRYLDFPRGFMRLENLLLLLGLTLLVRRLLIVLARQHDWMLNPLWRDLVLLLFCLHPMNTQIVGHIIQRGALLSAVGGFIALLLILDPQHPQARLRRIIAAFVWLLALLAKPNVFVMPLFWAVLLPVSGWRARARILWPFVLLLAVPAIYYQVGGFNTQGSQLSPWQYFIFQGTVIVDYFRLLLYPLDLRFNHDYFLVPGEMHWWGLATWAALFSIGAWLWRRHRPLGLAFVGFLVALMPESSFFPIIHLIFEHRFTVPMIFLAWMLALWRRPPAAAWFGILVALCACFSLTLSRNHATAHFRDWGSRELARTCRVEFFQLSLVSTLLRRGEVEAITAAFPALRKCTPPTRLLSAMEALVALADRNVPVAVPLTEINKVLHSDNSLDRHYRKLFSDTVIILASERLSEDELQCFVERVLANQMRAMLPDPVHFKLALDNYPAAVNGCQIYMNVKRVPAMDFDRLRMRAIMHRYYHSNDVALVDELVRAPQGEDWDYLRALVRETR